MIPVIRSNSTEGTPNFDVDYKKKRKRRSIKDGSSSVEEEEEEEDEDGEEGEGVETIQTDFGTDRIRPERLRQTERAMREVPEEVHQSRVLNKKLRLLRLFNLKESGVEMESVGVHGSTRSVVQKVVPRTSHHFHLQSLTNRKIQFVPRFVAIVLVCCVVNKHATDEEDTSYVTKGYMLILKSRFDIEESLKICSTHRYDKQSVKRRRMKRQAFDEGAHNRMTEILNFKTSVNRKTCKNFKKEQLYLPGDVGYNVDEVFGNQARTALRLSHFLSNFLQNVDKYEEYGNLRGDRLLNVEQVMHL